MVKARPRPLYPQKQEPVPTVRGAGRSRRVRGNLAPTGTRSPDRQVASSYTDCATAVHPTASAWNRFRQSGYKQISAQPKTMGCPDNQLEYEIMMFPKCLQERFTEGGAIRPFTSTRHFSATAVYSPRLIFCRRRFVRHY